MSGRKRYTGKPVRESSSLSQERFTYKKDRHTEHYLQDISEDYMITQKHILAAFGQLQTIAGPGAPVCACVTDEHGFILGYTQMDGMSSRAFTMARAKAYTAARMGQKTVDFHARLVSENLSLADFGDALMTSVQGGVPVTDKNGIVIGGVAVSGRRPEEDEHAACRLAALLVD